ncbi:impdh, partial [Symbiodinium microadriaticum]
EEEDEEEDLEEEEASAKTVEACALGLWADSPNRRLFQSRYALEDLMALPAPASAEAEVKLTTPLSKNVTLNAPLVAAPMDT